MGKSQKYYHLVKAGACLSLVKKRRGPVKQVRATLAGLRIMGSAPPGNAKAV
jgi:hypothetical protein